MPRLIFITHPEVIVDPLVPIERWRLSETGVRRMQAFAEDPVTADVTAIWSSAETKAREAAAILASRLGLAVKVDERLGENDRSATGFLPPDEFERAADAFFAEPTESFRGWERAVDAQQRVVTAVTSVLEAHTGGDVAIVAHGGVGALLLCALLDRAISRDMDQPSQGHYWVATLPDLRVEHGWRPIAPR